MSKCICRCMVSALALRATIALQILSLVEKAEPAQVHFTLRLRDHRSMWMQDGSKGYIDSYMASNGSCSMVTWTTSKNHLLEVGLTQNQETMGLRMLATIDSFYFIMSKNRHEIRIHWNNVWLRARLHMTAHYTRGFVSTLHGFGGALGHPLNTFFWVLTIPWSRLLAHVWSGPKLPSKLWYSIIQCIFGGPYFLSVTVGY